MVMDLVRDLRFDDVLGDHRRHRAEQVAVVDVDVRLSYRELADRVGALSRGLHDHGFTAGDRLVWLGEDSFRLLECFLATARLGGVFCPVSGRQPRESLDAILNDCDPAVVVGGDNAAYEAALNAHRGGPPIAETISPDAPLLLLYTVLGGRAIGMQVPRTNALHEAIDAALREPRRVEAHSQLHNVAPLIGALGAIIAGSTVVVSASPAVPRALLEL